MIDVISMIWPSVSLMKEYLFHTGCTNSGSLSNEQCLSYAKQYCALTCNQCQDRTTNPPQETETGDPATTKPTKATATTIQGI